MKKCFEINRTIKYGFISFFILLAFTMNFETNISRIAYGSNLNYYLDRIIESFFSYSFVYYLMIPLIFIAYVWIDCQTEKLRKSTKVLSMFFSSMLLFGESFRNTNSWDYIFLDGVTIIKSVVAILGFYFLFQAIIRLVYKGMEMSPFQPMTNKNRSRIFEWIFDEKKTMLIFMFRISMIILFMWLPVLVLCYPGGSCVDVTSQIEQALGNIPFSTQHSILHTLYLGACLHLGENIFHSYNIGLYIGIIIQTCLFVLVLSYSLYRLMKHKIKKNNLLVLLFIYCLTPIYSNLATMTIKDTLFCVSVFWFVIELASLLFAREEYLKNNRRMLAFVLSVVFTTLLRNNGIYVVCLTGIPFVIYLLRKKVKIREILILCGLPIVLYLLISSMLIFLTNASSISSKEMLSIPFQQTARYVKEYEMEITAIEYEALTHVFVDVDQLGEIYDPNISDPIKTSYVDDATSEELINYFKAWFAMGVKHPGTYIEAFLNLSYGWFDPGSNNWIRYEGRLPIFTTPSYLGTPDKAMYYIYNFLNRIPILGLLENVGIYIWALLLGTNYSIIKKEKRMLLAFTPLYVSLLVCVASPAFWLHPRYAFPIMLSMPFLWNVMWAETHSK